MDLLISAPMSSEVRRAFVHWSIRIPATFEETFVEEDGYWHAWDEETSVSLTSMAITDRRGRPAPAAAMIRDHPPLPGAPVDEMPPGLTGIAAYGPVPQPARASSALTGLIPVNGRVLIVTITADDLDWALETWQSIRHHDVPISPPTIRPRVDRRRRRPSRGRRA